MKKKNKGSKKKLTYKNAIIIFCGVFSLEILSIGLNRLAQFSLDHYPHINWGWLFNPWTHDMGFVGTPSLIAVFINSFIIGYISGKKGLFNAVIACTINGSFWALINVIPYNQNFMTISYIAAMLQTIPYYMLISFIGSFAGRKANFGYKD